MKKYLVKDEDEGLVVTELDEEPEKKTEDEDIEEEVHDDDALTPEEISALKSLAAVASDLVALVEKSKTSDEEEIVDEDEEIDDEEVEDEDEEALLDEDEEEEVIETGKAHDSKKSFGAIQRKSKPKDSLEDDEVATAWAKRYGGAK